jgi:DNA-binding XRE family transcriptional regulator
MGKQSAQRKQAPKAPTKKRARYIPEWQPLRAMWDARKDQEGWSQKAMALAAGATEGAISQLLKGDTKLTIEWALQFSTYMGVPIVDIWPDFPFRGATPGRLSPDEVEIALMFRMLKDPEQKKTLTNLLRAMQPRR